MRQLFLFFILMGGVCLRTFSQTVINGYAKVTSISGTDLSVSNASEVVTTGTFATGMQVIVMQMQDDVIGANINDDTNFGSISSIASAGLYEVKTIASVTRSGSLTAIKLTHALTNSYATGANSSVQVITFPKLGSPNYTTSFSMTALTWNGTNGIGGVLAFQVAGTLTIKNNLTADAKGFKGGAASTDYYSGVTGDCATTFRTGTGNPTAGEKGEGIYKRTDASYQYARAKIANGGGGGNHINSGGGGGGNYTTGGDGGPGWSCGSSVGGQGGLSLASYIPNTGTRVFMGGGGGGGQENDGAGSGGGTGGGIILIKANQIVTTGTCTTLTISSNGSNASSGNNDGQGGGGAGGSIIFQVSSFSLVTGCRIAVQASGGNGGTVNNTDVHGGGGGGGQGRVIYSGTQPSTFITTTTKNGTSGCNDSSSPCTSQAPSPSGTNNDGISASAGNTALPVGLLNFGAVYKEDENNVEVVWTTATEQNNQGFEVERSNDGVHFTKVGERAGAGTSYTQHHYQLIDLNPSYGRSYYRLKQTDWDGAVTYSEVSFIFIDKNADLISVYPNPVDHNGTLTVALTEVAPPGVIVKLYDLQGVEQTGISLHPFANDRKFDLPVSHLTPGIYSMQAIVGGKRFVKKIIIR